LFRFLIYTALRSLSFITRYPSLLSVFHSSSVSVLFCVQGEGLEGGKSYEGLDLDREYLEPVEVHTSPHDDAGLGAQAPEAELEQHAYIQVIADPEYAN